MVDLLIIDFQPLILERVLVSEANCALRAFTWSNSYSLAVLVEYGFSKDQLNDVY